jgi:hypothetical protein
MGAILPIYSAPEKLFSIKGLFHGEGQRSRAWRPLTLMSFVKPRGHGWTFSTLASVKLIRRWIVQRRGQDLKTSVIKL